MGDRDERQQRSSKKQVVSDDGGEDVDPRLKSCDPELIEKIEMEIVDSGDPIAFDDIAKDIILVVGATNRPQELDEAARRRFVKRLYIPLPSFDARLDMINRLLKDNKHELSDENTAFIAESTKGMPVAMGANAFRFWSTTHRRLT
ncbi:hypothetical protein BBJ28_00022410 [Nothophytophthora sp. Chile5]|nr:hypothetical protein BBJ28_00022410 [Nothophytophthora sp. Chile5]